MKINMRFANFETRSPILLEIEMDTNASIGNLRAMIESTMMVDDYCQMRVFDKWYFQNKTDNHEGFIEIKDTDSTSSISHLGIGDETVLYLDGPIIPSDELYLQNVGKSIATIHAKARRVQLEQAKQIHQLTNDFSALKTFLHKTISDQQRLTASNIKILEQKIDTLTNQNQQQAQQLEALTRGQESHLLASADIKKQQAHHSQTMENKIHELIADQQRNVKALDQKIQLCSDKLDRQISVSSDKRDSQGQQKLQAEVDKLQLAANQLLAKYPRNPLKVFWEALKDNQAAELAMMILKNSCGLDARTTPTDGSMCAYIETTNKSHNFNEEGLSGATPLVIATVARRVDVIKLLLAAGANAKLAYGPLDLYPIHVAALVNAPQAIELMVNAGINPSLPTKIGNTPPSHNIPFWE